jgi:hypothetical protein
MNFSATSGAELLGRIVEYIINPIILLIFSVGFLVFVWGLFQFMRSVESGGENADGKNHMIYGIIGMFIMVAIGSIISLIDDTFGLDIRGQTYSTGINRDSGSTSPFPTGTTGF